MSNLNQDTDAVILAIVTVAVATFAVVSLSGSLAKRFSTALVANNGLTKQIRDEAGDLLAVCMATSTYITTLGRARRELESVQSVGTTTY